MKKHLLTALFLAASVSLLRATAVDDAIATAQQLQVKISAASEFHTPTQTNVQNAKGDADSIKAFADNLASQLNGFNVGPVSQIKSVSADIDLRVNTLDGINFLNVSAMIDACRGLGDQLNNLQALLPDLIAALQGQKAAALIAVQTATQWTPPTPIPGTADSGQVRPTTTPFVAGGYPTPVPTATSIMQPGTAPSIPPVSNPGTLPGGPSLPPPPAFVPTPLPPQATPTPRPLLKAPMAIIGVGNGDDGDIKAKGRVYVANYNMANIAILDTYLKRVIGYIPVGNQPVAMDKTAEGMVVVANYASASVSLIDSKMDAVVATMNVGSQPVDVAVLETKAYVVNQGSNSVTIIDLKNLRLIRTVSVGSQPSRIALRHGRAYVSNTNDDSVSVIDTKIDDVIATVNE